MRKKGEQEQEGRRQGVRGFDGCSPVLENKSALWFMTRRIAVFFRRDFQGILRRGNAVRFFPGNIVRNHIKLRCLDR